MDSKQKAALMLGVMQGITGVSIDDIIDALPIGPTPNRYKPHQGRREMERRRRRMAAELPEGVRMLNGELQLRCRVCEKWYESQLCLSDIQTDYDPDYSYCGGSPCCCP